MTSDEKLEAYAAQIGYENAQLKTLRDEFAMAALTGLLASETESHNFGGSFPTAAKMAFQYADAMLAIRDKT